MSQMQGVFPILVTPYDREYRVDVESLKRLVEHQIQYGVHGLGVALGSEVYKLTEQERILVTDVVVAQAAGRVPVVINTGGEGNEQAVLYSQVAEDHGADALMCRPPTIMQADEKTMVDYFKAISDAVSIPIFVQDTDGAPVSASAVHGIVENCPNVKYLKAERLPTPTAVQQVVKLVGEKLTIFGGAGGNYLLEELHRGSMGTMPGCATSPAFVKLWDAYQAGDEAVARQIFYDQILPVNRMMWGWAGFYVVSKEILRRQGVIDTALVRQPASPLDPAHMAELDEVCERLFGV